jgi:acetyltransferase
MTAVARKTVASQSEFVPIDVQLRDGRRVALRDVCPQDKDAFQAVLKGLSEGSRYTRFMAALRALSPHSQERVANPDRTRERQRVAVCAQGTQETIVGGARSVGSAGSTDCGFGVAAADPWQGPGLAHRRLAALTRAACARGLVRRDGCMLASNERMLGLAEWLGFIEGESPEGPMVRMGRRDLSKVA